MIRKLLAFSNQPRQKFFLVLSLFLSFQYSNAAVYYVNDGITAGDIYTTAIGNDTNAGNTPGAPKATLLAAYNAAVAGDTIYVDTGLYTDVNATSFNITKSIHIIGAGFMDTVFKRTSGTDRWSTISASNVELKKFQISDYNYSSADGIALFISSGTGIILDQVGIYGSVGSGGQGALYISGNATSVTIQNVSLPCNRVASSSYGGALKITGSTVAIKNCSYSNNILSAIKGSAILIEGNTANVTIDNTLFENNEGASGGAIAITNGNVTINGSCFNSNKSVSTSDNLGGGAVIIQASTNGTTTNVNFNNCSFSNNSASGTSQDGGAVKITNLNSPTCNVVFNTCSFTSNSSTGTGCDLNFDQANSPTFSVTFKNNTFNSIYSSTKVNLKNVDFPITSIKFEGLTAATSTGGNGDIVADGSGVAVSKPEMTGNYTESTTNLPLSLPLTTCVDRFNGTCGGTDEVFICETKNAWGDISTTATSNASAYLLDKGVNLPKTITAATNASNIVFTSASHGFAVNDWVIVEGCTPTSYNGIYKITAIATNTFTVAKGSAPGTFTSGGTATKGTPIGWSRNAVPTIYENVIINYNYNTSTYGDINACRMTVSTGKTLTIDNDSYTTAGLDTNGTYVYVVNSITNNGTINVLSKANLVQVNHPKDINDENITTPIINFTKNTDPKIRWDYIYWSKCVLDNVLPVFASNFDKIFYWDSDFCTQGIDHDYLGWQYLTTNPQIGLGFITRIPTAIGTTLPGTAYNISYSGTSTNGDYSAIVKYYDNNTNAFRNMALLGNPYPGALDFTAFYNDNSSKIYGTAYFWTSYTRYDGNGEYREADFATFNLTGGVGVPGAVTQSPTAVVPNGYIPSGQAFVVHTKSAGTVSYKNSHRTKNIPSNNQFFKSNNSKNRYWLQITNSQEKYNQTLVGYIDGATAGFDDAYDGKNDSQSTLKLFSKLDNDNLIIQGKGNFVVNDTIKLGYTNNNQIDENLKISISKTEGIFDNDVSILLRDKELNIIHDLKESEYQFLANANTDNRFEIIYQNKNLPTVNENSEVIGFFNGNILNVKSPIQMDYVSLYDINGKLIFMSDTDNEVFEKTLLISSGIYILKTKLKDNSIHSIKMMKP